jgi:hypothetical protein
MKRRKRRRTAKKKRKGLFSKIAVAAIIVQVFVYTWAHLILSYLVGVEIAPAVSCAFYGFCGAEAGLLAWIKNTKSKKENESGEIEHERTDFSETDEP